MRQFPLLGFLLCIMDRAAERAYEIARLSIPFIGIFALHLEGWRSLPHGISLRGVDSFNSLYWDFCSASEEKTMVDRLKIECFQFPLLGFLLCIIRSISPTLFVNSLSIPFIGIFALHPIAPSGGYVSCTLFQFPLLGFLLCIVQVVSFGKYWSVSFNSLYWDFCSASTQAA